MTAQTPTVAIVIPVFNEESVLPELFARLEALFARPCGNAWRAVFVNDGSRDRSVALGLMDAGAGLDSGRGKLRAAMLDRLSALLRRLGASEHALQARTVMLQHLVKAIFALPQDDLKLAEGLDQEAQAVLQGYLERATGT